MKRLLVLVILLTIYSCKKEAVNLVNYTIFPITIKDKPMLKVQLNCRAEQDGTTDFLFLNDTWGEKDLYNCIESIKTKNEHTFNFNKDSTGVVFNHPKGLKNLEFEYIIKQDTEGDLTTKMLYRPVIQEGYFHVFSHSLFMIPSQYNETKTTAFDVVLNWKNFPEAYNLQNSFGTNQRIQKIKNTSENEFMESVFLGGDYRTHELDIKNNKVAFSTRGKWQVFQDSTLIKILKTTIMKQRDFWKDHSQPYFSVNITPTVQEHGSSFQGTGLSNSFDCSAANNKHLDLNGLVYLFNHELQHNWIGHLIKNEDEEAQYWFSEGFTDYYTIKNIAKYKINNLDENYFINEFNNTIKLLYTSSVKEAPNSEITYENFWTSRDYEKLPYRRGRLFAFYLDYKIKQDSNGKQCLDDLMLAIKEDAEKTDQKISHDYFMKKVNTFLKDDITSFFNKHIEQGQLFDLETIFKDFGFEFNETATVFYLGFTYDETTKIITTIDQDSKAFKNGLRKEDKIVGWSIYYGDINNDTTIVVERAGKKLTFTFLPVKQEKIAQLLSTKENVEKLNF